MRDTRRNRYKDQNSMLTRQKHKILDKPTITIENYVPLEAS